ncbi:MAG: lactate utilization protein [Candidatus Tectomicrobia bacterium]
MSSQAAFLARVRRALDAQSATHVSPTSVKAAAVVPGETMPQLRARLATQRPALLARVQEELTAVGGIVTCVQSAAQATHYITQLARHKEAALIVRWQAAILEGLEIDAALQQQGIDVHSAALPAAVEVETAAGQAMMEARRRELRQVVAGADLCLSRVDSVIAETGTLVLSALPGQMRGVSLLPPVHVAVARSEQVVAKMADYLALLRADGANLQHRLTSCISFVTGPSRTGDIELALTTGVHGPGELHRVIIDEPEALTVEPLEEI